MQMWRKTSSPNNRQNVSWLRFLSPPFLLVWVLAGVLDMVVVASSKYLQFEEISSYANEMMNEYDSQPQFTRFAEVGFWGPLELQIWGPF